MNYFKEGCDLFNYYGEIVIEKFQDHDNQPNKFSLIIRKGSFMAVLLVTCHVELLVWMLIRYILNEFNARYQKIMIHKKIIIDKELLSKCMHSFSSDLSFTSLLNQTLNQ